MMRKENGSANHKRSDQESIAEDHHELSGWQTRLITKRLAEADSGDEGLEHSEVFGQLKWRLEAKT